MDKSNEEKNELYLTNLIDIEMLQRIQDAFGDMTWQWSPWTIRASR